MDKVNEKIIEISGTETEPFMRFAQMIPLDKFMELLVKSKEDATKSGYTDIHLHVKEDGGLIDISLYGDREQTPEELKVKDELCVIARRKPRSMEGLDRNQILGRTHRH